MDLNEIRGEIEQAQRYLEDAINELEEVDNNYGDVKDERDALRSALRSVLDAADIDPGFTDDADELTRMAHEYEKYGDPKALTPLSMFVKGYTVGLKAQINKATFEYHTIVTLKNAISRTETLGAEQ